MRFLKLAHCRNHGPELLCRGFTHWGALCASGSLWTSHSSRTLGRKEGNGGVWWAWGRQ